MKPQQNDMDGLNKLLDTYSQELLAMSDEDVFDGADGAALKAAGLKLLDAAKAEAAKRRLALAKAAASLSSTEAIPLSTVSPEQARAYLRKAANDPRYTLAARDLSEMSDADVLNLYAQLMSLEQQGETPDEGA